MLKTTGIKYGNFWNKSENPGTPSTPLHSKQAAHDPPARSRLEGAAPPQPKEGDCQAQIVACLLFQFCFLESVSSVGKCFTHLCFVPDLGPVVGIWGLGLSGARGSLTCSRCKQDTSYTATHVLLTKLPIAPGMSSPPKDGP